MDLSIREILDTVLRGQIRIPAFQRGFVWEPDRVAYLMDSIYKGFPFGSLLFWRTKEQLKSERSLGPFSLPPPAEDYPVDYVLDGQQRITSIFGVFQTQLQRPPGDTWQDIYFDHTVDRSAQEPLFFALSPTEVDPKRHFPLRTLFDTTAYRKATSGFDEALAKKIDDMQTVFKEVRIPVQQFRTEDKATVAIIFERVNRQGVPLDTLQLLSAWTWSDDFQLQGQFGELAEQLEPFGFGNMADDSNLILRCCSAILGGDASPESLMSLTGQNVRARFQEVLNGIRGAVDYVRSNFQVHSLGNLPYANLLVPLSTFFSVDGNKEIKYTDQQRAVINKWFWRACFAKRYSSGLLRNLNADVDEMRKLRAGKPSNLGGFAMQLSDDVFTSNIFTIGTVNTNALVLLLAHQKPLSFVSGAPIDLGEKLRQSNRAEFHHLMPKAIVQSSSQTAYSPNCLANFAFISRADNRVLGGVPPSNYRQHMPADSAAIFERALCPETELMSDNLEAFIKARAEVLRSAAEALCI
ncbi:MAG: DUF262 domain-containing protein [Comamonadaceae bacterium]|nr:MAG: DUF262 domain-containing protein [Comamonadaceae bacterium]